MLSDITLGQFFPGKSVIHRLDPRFKLIFLLAYITVMLLCSSLLSYGIMLGFLSFATALSRISVITMMRGLRPMIFIIILTAVLSIFYTAGQEVASFWILKITQEGLWRALFMVLRLIMLISGTFLLTYTTSPIMLTDALSRIMSPLAKLKVPVHELSMMMTIALRFIPTIIEETEKIMSAQKARGADFNSGSLLSRAKSLIPLLVPLFFSAFRRADELAGAMECRCYHGGEGRTRMKQLHLTPLDGLAGVFCLVVFSGAAVLGIFGV
ncbi:MAG: energy-coupling factor transporter transmembrane protein EcfT [Oscillospiraceae bacterium]|nr:energy-coupling factor transporter transmembrane protein EcfT [Oscillospiraceae bacterium]